MCAKNQALRAADLCVDVDSAETGIALVSIRVATRAHCLRG